MNNGTNWAMGYGDGDNTTEEALQQSLTGDGITGGFTGGLTGDGITGGQTGGHGGPLGPLSPFLISSRLSTFSGSCYGFMLIS
jgi:hypothetical protein